MLTTLPCSRERCLRCFIVLCAAPLLCCGCGDGADDGESATGGALVDASEWKPVDEAEDPFIADKAEDAVCDSLGYQTEDYEGEQALFVDTEACDYLSVEQPALRSVAEGDTLHLRLYHFELTAPDPGEAHLAVAFGQHTVWEKTVDIPADAKLIDTTWQADEAVEVGDSVLFHVNNHGDNNYVFIEFSKMN